MPIAALLAILARRIDMYIFQPTYLEDEDDVIRQLLVRLSVEDSKESFCRGLLLSIRAVDQEENATNAVKRVVREVGWYVQELLSGSDYDSFRAGLDQVVRQACETWHIVQRAKERFEPNFELSPDEDLEWYPLVFGEEDAGTAEQIKSASDEDEELFVIFPPIFLLEDGPPYPMTSGVVLMKSQSIAATQEIESYSPSSPIAAKTASRHKPTRSRTKSVSLNGGKDSQPWLLQVFAWVQQATRLLGCRWLSKEQEEEATIYTSTFNAIYISYNSTPFCPLLSATINSFSNDMSKL